VQGIEQAGAVADGGHQTEGAIVDCRQELPGERFGSGGIEFRVFLNCRRGLASLEITNLHGYEDAAQRQASAAPERSAPVGTGGIPPSVWNDETSCITQTLTKPASTFEAQGRRMPACFLPFVQRISRSSL